MLEPNHLHRDSSQELTGNSSMMNQLKTETIINSILDDAIRLMAE